MKQKNLLDYLEKYEEFGKILDDANIKGDYKTNNKTYDKMHKIFELAKESKDRESFYLHILHNSTSASALIYCCADMMKLDIYPKQARTKLEEIAKNEEYDPILTFNAEMFLEEWDKGNIKKQEF